MTKTQIIETAAQWADIGTLSQEQLDRYLNVYETELASLLKRQPWKFTMGIVQGDTFTTSDTQHTRGYNYVYDVPSNIVKILDLNPGVRPPTIDPREAIKYGWAVSSLQTEGGDLTSNYVLSGGKLYTDCKVQTAIVQYDVDEVEMDGDFRLALIYKLASFLAFSTTSDFRKSRELSKMFDDQFMIAVMQDIKPKNPGDLYEQALIKWIYKQNRNLYTV